MPMFIQTTDRLLSDPELLKSHQMDIYVVDNNMKQESENIDFEEEVKLPSSLHQQGNHKLIQMVTMIQNEDSIGHWSGGI